MKLKKAWIYSVLTTSLVLSACGKEQSPSTNTPADNQTIVVNENIEPLEDNYDLYFELSQNATYNSEIMNLTYGYEEFQGQIKDILPRRNEYYVYTSEGIFKDTEKLFVPSQPITEFNVFSFYRAVNTVTIATHNEDGTYSVYLEWMNEDPGSTAEEVVSGLTYEPIFAWYEEILNELFVFMQGENGYYVNLFTLDEERNVLDSVQTWPIRARNDDLEIFSEDITQLLPEYYLLLSNNSMHSTFGYSSGNEYADYATVDTKSINIPNVSRIVPPNSDFLYKNPLFEEVGDNSNLYVYTSDIEYTEYDDQYKICIPLPDGYTTDKIQNVLFNEDLLIEFSTGDIYVSQKDSIDCLQIQEALSSLNKEGKIKKILRNSLHFCTLMDDNCVYELNLF